MFEDKSTQQAANAKAILRSTVAPGDFSMELKIFDEIIEFSQSQGGQYQELWKRNRLLKLLVERINKELISVI